MSDAPDTPVTSLAPFFATVKPLAPAFCNGFFSSVTGWNMINGFLSLIVSSGRCDRLIAFVLKYNVLLNLNFYPRDVSMKNFIACIVCCCLLSGVAYAESDCYIVTEDALIADSQQTWEMANMMLRNQEMEKLTRLSLEEKIAVLKKGDKIHLLSAGPILNEIRTEKDRKRWFIAIEVAKPCPKEN